MPDQILMLVEVNGETTKATAEIAGGLTVSVAGKSSDEVLRMLSSVVKQFKTDTPAPVKRKRSRKGKHKHTSAVDAEIEAFAENNPIGFRVSDLRDALARAEKTVRFGLQRAVHKGVVVIADYRWRKRNIGKFTKLYKHSKFQTKGN